MLQRSRAGYRPCGKRINTLAVMAKEKTIYTCTECGGISPKWLGKCPHCNAWNTLIESVAEAAAPARNRFAPLAAVAEVAVVGFPDARLGERACAYVRLRDGASLTLTELVAHLETQKMARQYMPERLEIVGELPRTPSGKIQKFRLREMAREAATLA